MAIGRGIRIALILIVRNLIFVLVFLASITLKAEGLCGGTLVRLAEGIDKDLHRVTSTVAQLNEGLLSKMKKPKKVVFNYGGLLNRCIGATHTVLRHNDRDYSEVEMRAIDSHEYVHLNFFYNMADYSPTWKALFDRLQKQIELPNSVIYESIDFDESETKAYSSGPYQEFWSDLVTALYVGFDPYQRLMERFRTPNTSESELVALKARAFVYPFPSFSTSPFLERIDFDPFKLSHYALNPARNYLYQNFLVNKKVMAKLPDFLPVVFKSLAEEVAPILEHALLPADGEKLNSRLIDRFEKNLASFKE